MKYIHSLEAVGFERAQAEAQVQMVLDAIEGELVTKSDFGIFKEHIDRRFFEVEHRFTEMAQNIRELELRLLVKLGFAAVSLTTLIIAILGWLIKNK